MTENDASVLKSCPMCASLDVAIMVPAEGRRAVECGSCGTRGGSADSVHGAMLIWNRRSTDEIIAAGKVCFDALAFAAGDQRVLREIEKKPENHPRIHESHSKGAGLRAEATSAALRKYRELLDLEGQGNSQIISRGIIPVKVDKVLLEA